MKTLGIIYQMLSWFLGFDLTVTAAELFVPSQYDMIQVAVSQAQDHDTVLLEPGIYTNAGNWNVDLSGKALTISAQAGLGTAVIDCALQAGAFLVQTNESTATVLENLLIINALGPAFDIRLGSPTISHCRIVGTYGHAISVQGSSAPVIDGCIIEASSGFGLNIMDSQAAPIVSNTQFHNGSYYPVRGFPDDFCRFTDNNYTNNALNRILVEGGLIDFDCQWSDVSIEYDVIGDLTVANQSGGSVPAYFTLSAGATLNMVDNVGLYIGEEAKTDSRGCLRAIGTPMNKIQIKPGGLNYWSGLFLSSDGETEIEHVVLMGGGAPTNQLVESPGVGTLVIITQTGCPQLRDLEISASQTTGVYLGPNTQTLLERCVIHDCRNSGVVTDAAETTVISSEICANDSFAGGGIVAFGSDVILFNVLCADNHAINDGGAINCLNSDMSLQNCTIANNTAKGTGGGLYVYEASTINIEQTIMWGDQAANGGNEISIPPSKGQPKLVINYSDIEMAKTDLDLLTHKGIEWGEGNINADPLFVGHSGNDYRLAQLLAGQAVTSPCVNAGGIFTEMVCHQYGMEQWCVGKASTRTDSRSDLGLVDLGFHYPIRVASHNPHGIEPD